MRRSRSPDPLCVVAPQAARDKMEHYARHRSRSPVASPRSQPPVALASPPTYAQSPPGLRRGKAAPSAVFSQSSVRPQKAGPSEAKAAMTQTDEIDDPHGLADLVVQLHTALVLARKDNLQMRDEIVRRGGSWAAPPPPVASELITSHRSSQRRARARPLAAPAPLSPLERVADRAFPSDHRGSAAVPDVPARPAGEERGPGDALASILAAARALGRPSDSTDAEVARARRAALDAMLLERGLELQDVRAELASVAAELAAARPELRRLEAAQRERDEAVAALFEARRDVADAAQLRRRNGVLSLEVTLLQARLGAARDDDL